MQRSITREVGAGLAAAVLLAVATGVLAYLTIQRMVTSAAAVEHSHLVLNAVTAEEAALRKVQAAARSYVLLADSGQLLLFAEARGEADSALAKLEGLLRGDPAQHERFARLEPVSRAFVGYWGAVIEQRTRDGPGSALRLLRLPGSDYLLPSTISQLHQMEAVERSRLARRQAQNEAGARATVAVLTLAVVLTLLVLAGTFFLFRRHLRFRDRAEEEQVRLQRFLDSIVETIPFMLFVKDATDLRFVRLNQAGETLLGLPRGELLGKNDHDLFPAAQAEFFNRKDREALAARGLVTIEEEPIDTATQGRRLLRTRKTAILGPDGEPAFLLGMSEDVTERKQAEERLRVLNEELVRRTAALEEANRELESFSYSVSHDLRAPLRAIEGFSRILLEEHTGQLDAEGQRLFAVVRRNAQRMGRLIDDLLAFSRVGRRDIDQERVDMASVVRSQLAELVEAEPEREVQVTVDPLPPARGDGALLRQVTANLLENAFKFTRGRSDPVVIVSARAANGEVQYTVRDNGAGFDPRYAGKLFGVFQRLHKDTEFEGTGVGLAIVQRIVHRHGGRVWAEAEPGRGATFHFTLPAAEPGP